jgi:hypothetical protein
MEGDVRGWYSPRFGLREPVTVVEVARSRQPTETTYAFRIVTTFGGPEQRPESGAVVHHETSIES